MRYRTASALGLLGFAAAAAVAALAGTAFTVAVTRAIAACIAMAVVGYIAGVIAERAIAEAVDSKFPVYAPPEDGQEKQGVSNQSDIPDQEEEDK